MILFIYLCWLATTRILMEINSEHFLGPYFNRILYSKLQIIYIYIFIILKMIWKYILKYSTIDYFLYLKYC